MPKLVIDGITVDVPQGATLLEAAKQAGIAIPTLCHAQGIRPLTSCMICAVKDVGTGRTLPACTAKAQEGMSIETNSPEILEARREILQLLLSEHAGDCEGPCTRRCPASLNIPLMLRTIAKGDMAAAAGMAYDALVLPATLGWVCGAPCQAVCRRAACDEPVAIRDLHRQAAEAALEGNIALPPCAPDSGKRLAVAGGGVAGLAAAWVLRRQGHACRVYEKNPEPGGSLRDLPEERLPRAILDAEIDVLRHMGVEFFCGAEANPEALLDEFEAVVIACKGFDGQGEGMFSAKEARMPVRSVAAGKAAAEAAHRFVSGPLAANGRTPYDSTLGRLSEDEARAYAAAHVSSEILQRPSQPGHPQQEAERCLHCDCRAPLSCKLRQYATEYGVEPPPSGIMERPDAGEVQRFGDVLFEPGKCIKCGLCIEVTRQKGEGLGLTFIGRGFDTCVRVPFGESLEAGLGNCAQECIEVCPTGALTFAGQEEVKPCE